MCWDSGTNRSAKAPSVEPEEVLPDPNPDPYRNQRSLPLGVPLLLSSLPCARVIDPPGDCDESAGPSLLSPPAVPDVEFPVPDPAV
jgi:hypothetical protein